MRTEDANEAFSWIRAADLSRPVELQAAKRFLLSGRTEPLTFLETQFARSPLQHIDRCQRARS